MNKFSIICVGLFVLLAFCAAALCLVRTFDSTTACENPIIREIQETSWAIRQNPAAGDLFLRRAKAYHTLGKLEKAVADYNQAITRGQNNAAVYLARAKCYSDLDQNSAALQDALHAQELAPPTPVSYHRLADIYTSMKNYDKAQTAFAQGLKLSPTNAALLTCRARMYQQSGDYKGAARGYDKAIAADPTYIFAYYCRGRLRAKQRAREQALRDFSVVINAPPTCYLRRLQLDAYINRARVLHRLNRPSFWLDFFRIFQSVVRKKLVDVKIWAAEAGRLPLLRTVEDAPLLSSSTPD